MIRRILVPIDFSIPSRKSLEYAAPFAKHFGAEIVLVHVVEPSIYPADFSATQVGFPNVDEELRRHGREELATLVDKVKTTVPARSIIRTGRAFLEITRVAKEEQVDLIIIASHGHTGVEHIFFGSTAEKVVRKSPCPVMVLRDSGSSG